MDLTSYLLGKKAGGGGTPISLQTKNVTVTENGTTTINPDSGYGGLSKVNLTTNVSTGGVVSEYFEQNIENAQKATKFIKKFPDISTSRNGSMSSFFDNYTNLVEIGKISILNCTDLSWGFSNCVNLEEIKEIKTTSTLTNTDNMFYGTSKLTETPLFDTSGVTTCKNMFAYCSKLTTIPQYDLSSITNINNMRYMFQSTFFLTDQSLDNVLKMCISTNTTGSLADLGFGGTFYPSSRVQALPSYQDFINAGWTMGY